MPVVSKLSWRLDGFGDFLIAKNFQAFVSVELEEIKMKRLRHAMRYLALFIIAGSPTHVLGEDFKFGVVALRGAAEAVIRWKPLIQYFAQAANVTFDIVPLKSGALDDAARKGEVDVVLCNPATAVSIIERAQGIPLATLKTNGVYQFGGVILAKKGRGISKGEHLRGKRVVGHQFGESAGAYVFQVYHLLQMGIDAHRDFAEFIDLKKQDDVILAVSYGSVDAGFVRSDLLERMAGEGAVKMEDFVVVDQRQDNYPYVHSTKLYPDWFLIATPRVSETIAETLKRAALSLKPTDLPASASKIDGFVEAQSLNDLRDALQTLKLPPFDM